MKRLFLAGMIVMAAICTACDKENKENEEQQEVEVNPELKAEFDAIVGNQFLYREGIECKPCFTTGDGKHSLKIPLIQYETYSSINKSIDGQIEFPCGNLPPKERTLAKGYYQLVKGETGDFNCNLKMYNNTVGLETAILHVTPGQKPPYTLALRAANGDCIAFNLMPTVEGFPAETVSIKQAINFPQDKTTLSAVYRKKPVSGKDFDVLDITLTASTGKPPVYKTTLHFIVNPNASLSSALGSLAGRYYGLDSSGAWADHKVVGFDLNFASVFTVTNDWEEIVTTEYVRPSESDYLTLALNSDKSILTVSGSVDRYIYLIGSEKYRLNVSSPTMKVADIKVQ